MQVIVLEILSLLYVPALQEQTHTNMYTHSPVHIHTIDVSSGCSFSHIFVNLNMFKENPTIHRTLSGRKKTLKCEERSIS